MDPPFSVARQLCSELDDLVEGPTSGERYLPSYPRILLRDQCGMLEFLESEYCSTDLDQISGKLWWMSKQDSTNISPLHKQRVKRRTIIITEDPRLHLVWIRDRIFIKPLPRYLTSNAFWKNYLAPNPRLATCTQTQRIRRAALGFLRTYMHLIRSEHDFHIAQDTALRLIDDSINWEQFCHFISSLMTIADEEVSERYIYGEIRLTRLNFYAPLLLRRASFQRIEYQTGEFFAQFYGPILFVIGLTSIVLNGFQIAVGVQQASPIKNGQMLLDVALWFSVIVMLCFSSLLFLFCFILVYKIVKEWKFAIGDRYYNSTKRGQSFKSEIN